MKNFVVLKKDDDIKVVKKGWSWTAFFFGIFWAIYNKLWLVFILTFIFIFGLAFISQFIPNLTESSDSKTIQLALSIFGYSLTFLYGFFGNKIKMNSFLSKGYKKINEITAKNYKEAVKISSQDIDTNYNDTEFNKNDVSIDYVDTTSMNKLSENDVISSSEKTFRYLHLVDKTIPWIEKLGFYVKSVQVDYEDNNQIDIYFQKIKYNTNEENKIMKDIEDSNLPTAVIVKAIIKASNMKDKTHSKNLKLSGIQIQFSSPPKIKILYSKL